MQNLRIVYAGTPEFAVPALEAITRSQHQLVAVLTQPDRKSGRGRKISKSAVKQAITSEKIPIFQPDNVNNDKVLSELLNLNIDLIVVAAYGQIFSEELLNLPKLGCINIHASLLPKWRGASPIQHAILAGEDTSGVTIMQMQRAMDAGDIWLQVECVISNQDTALSLHDKLAELGGAAILDAIDKVTNGSCKPTPQEPLNISYCSKLKKSDGLVNWSESAKGILRKVRAFHPWPGAYSFLNGRRLRITKALLAPTTAGTAKPGCILEVSKLGICVATGEHVLVISELVPEGGKCVSGIDFSNSNQLENQVLGEIAD
jgi:methionyl-tRNA formyltransferase